MYNKVEVKIDFCLNIQPTPRPSPPFNTGGDCFICATRSIFVHLFPENPPSCSQVAEWWEYRDPDTNKPNPGTRSYQNTWYGQENMCNRASYDSGYKVEHFMDFIYPAYDFKFFSHGWGHANSGYEYERRIEAWLKSGWVILAEINYNGEGPVNKHGFKNHPDHFIVLDGVRQQLEDGPFDETGKILSHSLIGYIHVVCSAKGMYWIKTDDLTFKHGLGAFYIIRRSCIE